MPPPPHAPPEHARLIRGWKRWLYIALGLLCAVLGILGAVLPALPATPFLILAMWLLSRSSRRLSGALRRCWFVGPILDQWERERSVRPAVKLQAVLLIGAGMALLAWYPGIHPVVRIALFALTTIGLIVVLALPTRRPTGARTENCTCSAGSGLQSQA
jgi:uncharacterized membrane protein YbaN (DUF454 family)